MCQLIFSNLGNKRRNSQYVMAQSIINSRTTHQDGFGLFNEENGIWRTVNYPANITNIGRIIYEYSSDSPMLAHNRLASVGNKNKIGVDYSHPFRSDHFILAHNGTLELNWKSVIHTDAKKIDSQLFLDGLEMFYNKEKDIVKLLNMTMKEFKGKFAFIIYHIDQSKYYIVRGKTADLHYCDIITNTGDNLGFVLNTEKDSMKEGILFLSNLISVVSKGVYLEVDKNKIVNIAPESIFTIDKDNDLVKIGEIKENERATVYVTNEDSYYAGKRWNAQTKRYEAVDKNEEENLVNYLINFIKKFEINLDYLDEIFYKVHHKGIIQADKEDLSKFVFYLDNLEKTCKGFGPNHIKEWRGLLRLGLFPLEVHTLGGLSIFPYMLASKKQLEKLGKDLEKIPPEKLYTGVNNDISN